MNEKSTVKEQIKIALAKRNMTLTDVYKQLKEKYNKDYTLQNLSSKINRNTLKYKEAEEIAEILNIKIEWNEKN